MKLYERETVEELVYKGFICSVCKIRYEADDFFELQEALHFKNCCGYGSVFGDGNTISLDICQYCISRVLGVYAEIEEAEYYE